MDVILGKSVHLSSHQLLNCIWIRATTLVQNSLQAFPSIPEDFFDQSTDDSMNGSIIQNVYYYATRECMLYCIQLSINTVNSYGIFWLAYE